MAKFPNAKLKLEVGCVYAVRLLDLYGRTIGQGFYARVKITPAGLVFLSHADGKTYQHLDVMFKALQPKITLSN